MVYISDMEWDEKKNKANLKKHYISFEEASAVFNDPHGLEIYDAQHSTGTEDRYICMGDVGGFVIVVVVFTERDGTTRIISARRADSDEEETYYENLRRTLERN